MQQHDGWLRYHVQDSGSVDRLRRQALPPLFARNGPAVLACRVDALISQQAFYGAKVAAYPMAEEDSVDIDSPLDLAWAEFLLARRKSQP
jgi:CMP-N-acetylneuraminic acid synthetase